MPTVKAPTLLQLLTLRGHPFFIESRLAAALFLGACILCASAQRTLGQRSDTPSIRVAPLIVADRASQISLGITVGPPEAVPTNTYLRVRGMPPRVSLTEGHAIGPGSWAIPLGGLPSLKANIPVDAGGRAGTAGLDIRRRPRSARRARAPPAALRRPGARHRRREGREIRGDRARGADGARGSSLPAVAPFARITSA